MITERKSGSVNTVSACNRFWIRGTALFLAAVIGWGNIAYAETVGNTESTEAESSIAEENTEAGAEQASANLSIAAPSGILMEASTGQVIYEKDADTRRSPASVTKVMTMLLTFEALEQGKIKLTDEVITSAHAKSMGGSQVFLEEGEIQSVETLMKCIVVASGNDASVAMAEHIAGSEEAFVAMMNEKAAKLGMENTHFEDCCGLTSSDNHYTTARDIAVMSRELITKYPQVFQYTKIWMEDITHTTAKGSSPFTLSSTNKLLKQYEWATGLKTGSTSKAKYCLSATANRDGIDMIAVVMAAPDYKVRFQDAITMLNYGFAVSHVYVDENKDTLENQPVTGGIVDSAALKYAGEFRYLDTAGNDLNGIEKQLHLPASVNTPVKEGDKAGEAVYLLNGKQIGMVDILFAESVEKAVYKDYLQKVMRYFLL
ncbi:MAG: D-alanyl-D-alanine carboxypeptidase [Lachnospiraceae bacterium]|nr:D-alanyl-D-alanine carboxypeptidase [Lachnospiraceae bacterium]